MNILCTTKIGRIKTHLVSLKVLILLITRLNITLVNLKLNQPFLIWLKSACLKYFHLNLMKALKIFLILNLAIYLKYLFISSS